MHRRPTCAAARLLKVVAAGPVARCWTGFRLRPLAVHAAARSPLKVTAAGVAAGVIDDRDQRSPGRGASDRMAPATCRHRRRFSLTDGLLVGVQWRGVELFLAGWG